MKRNLFAILCIQVIIIIFVLSGCSNNLLEDNTEEKAKPVKVIMIENETRSRVLSYVGHIRAKEMKSLSFKTGGEIAEIFVKEGEFIKKGDILASLETEDLIYAVNVAMVQKNSAWTTYQEALKGVNSDEIETAIANVEAAKDLYNLAIDNFENTKDLYDNDAITRNAYNVAAVEYEIKVLELAQAEEVLRNIITTTSNEQLKMLMLQYEQLKLNYELKKNQLESVKIKADIEGVVVSVLSKKAEIVGAGYPVIIIRSIESILVVGITQNDIDDVETGIVAKANINGNEISGEISRIDETPDNISRTYNIDITLKESGYRIGTIAKASIPVGTIEGIWIPITSVLTNGDDFVYVIVDDRAVRKSIVPVDFMESYVRVTGLSEDDILIVEGIGILKENNIVEIIEE